MKTKRRLLSLLLCGVMMVSSGAPPFSAGAQTIQDSGRTADADGLCEHRKEQTGSEIFESPSAFFSGAADIFAAESGIVYLDGDGNRQTAENAAVVESGLTTWNSGWYVVSSSEITIDSRITVNGAVHLILADGCHLNASRGGIEVSAGNSLIIYGQTGGTGALTAVSSDDDAGIGSGLNSDGGEIIINGGTVTATGGDYCAGIGGGNGGAGGTITINGGTVTAAAAGGYSGTGIGGGNGGAGGTITINGGTVTATGRKNGAGIGGGTYGDGGTITINGGTVTATGGDNGPAGIGGGSGGAGGTITINGGTVTATAAGNYSGAGIGGGFDSESGTFSTGLDGSAFIIASSISDDGDKTGWSGVILVNGTGQVYGSSVTLNTSAEIPAGAVLTVPPGAVLTVSDSITLTSSGTITVEPGGKLTGNVTGGTVSRPSDETGVMAVSVDGISGTADETNNTVFSVILPFGTASLPADSSVIRITAADENAAVSSPATADGGAVWTFTVTAEDRITTRDYTISVKIAENPAAGNIADIAAAAAEIRSKVWTAGQSVANTEAAVKSWIENQLAAMNLNGVTYAVSITGFTAAAAGDSTNRNGTDGSFAFDVSLSKGTGDTLAADTVTGMKGTITATQYQVKNYTVSVSASPAEGGTVSGGGTYAENASVTVTASARGGYQFVKWTENGREASVRADYTFPVTGSRTLIAVFEKNSSGSGSGNTGSSGSGSGNTGSSGSGNTGSGNTGSSGSGSGGSGNTGSGSLGGSGSTGTKQPVLKDSSGRKGWDVILAEAQKAAAASEGGTVAVDMNGAVSVPASVLEGIRGKNITVSFDMGGGFAWSVNGKDITADNISDVDFSVKAGAGTIPKELVRETAGSLAHLELSVAFDGPFGFTATLMIRIGTSGNGVMAGGAPAAEYNGMYANLFFYNPALRRLEFVCAEKVGEDGTAGLPFTHASDYTVILSAAPMGGTGMPGNPQKPEETEKPQEPAKKAVGSVKLSRTLYTYNGKPKKPSVTAVDTEGRKIPAEYYAASYKNNTRAGKATVTVRFKDGYSGTVKKTFTIRPAGTSIRKLTASSGGFAVKWKKKTAQVSGYQIQYSTDKGFKGNSTCSVSVKKASVTKKEVKNLKAGEKYYVRIRTYKTVKADGKNTKVYSAWSGAVRAGTLPASGGKNTASSVRAGAFPAAGREDGRKREV